MKPINDLVKSIMSRVESLWKAGDNFGVIVVVIGADGSVACGTNLDKDKLRLTHEHLAKATNIDNN